MRSAKLGNHLKYAALTRKCRKRLHDVENFTNKIVWMRLLAFGSHVTSRNRVSMAALFFRMKRHCGAIAERRLDCKSLIIFLFF